MINVYDKLIEAIGQLNECKHEPWPPYFLMNPNDYRLIHINKISFRFMEIIKRNRKLRNNGFKK